MTHAEVISLLKAKLRIRLEVTTYHGERDEIHGAKITEASMQEVANAIVALATSKDAK